MLELTALAVSGVATAYRRGPIRTGQHVEVTWRHYAYDPDGTWFLEVEVDWGNWRERTTALAG